MITTKLKKDCHTKEMMIQFSNKSLPSPYDQFYKICKEEGVQICKGNLMFNQLNFYQIQTQKIVEIRNVKLQNVPDKLHFAISIQYINAQSQQFNLEKVSPLKRTLLLRQGLDTKFYLEYQFQNTQSQFQSLIYLCELTAALINAKNTKNIDFYDQKTQQIKGSHTQNLQQRIWRNIFFQIPGLGKQKCIAISQKYPTYKSILNDFENQRQLKNTLVSRGTKQVKLGASIANRIYRSLLFENGNQSIYEQ